MTSRQLQDLTPQELLHYAQANAQEAEARARAMTRATTIAEAARARTKTTCLRCAEEAVEAVVREEAANAVMDAATEAALARAAEASTRLPAAERAVVMDAAVEAAEENEETRLWARAAIKSAFLRTATLAYLDIAHKERMLGEWPLQIQREAVIAAKREALDLLEKQANEQYEKSKVKKHMGSMLGDWDKAGKLSKRRIKKNIRKTKRRRQKITKRRRRK